MSGEQSIRSTIRAWWKAEVEDASDIDLKELAGVGAAHLQRDPDFCARYLAATLQPLVYSVGLMYLTQMRGMVAHGNRVMTKEQIIAAIDQKLASEPPEWARWLEHDPTSGKHIAFLDLTKEQALAAAEERDKRAHVETRRAGLLRLAAGKCAPGQRIGEVWTPEGLAELDKGLTVGRPKVSIKPGGRTMTIDDIVARSETAAD